jgi:hypothetical protein
MGSANKVGTLYPDSFSGFAIGQVTGAALSATGNAVATIPVIGGGLTNNGNTATSGAFIVRQITFMNASGTSPNTANVAIYTSNDGNASNIVTANTILTQLTTNLKFQDVTFTGTANTAISAASTQAFFLCVNGAGGANSKVDISIYGDIVNL